MFGHKSKKKHEKEHKETHDKHVAIPLFSTNPLAANKPEYPASAASKSFDIGKVKTSNQDQRRRKTESALTVKKDERKMSLLERAQNIDTGSSSNTAKETGTFKERLRMALMPEGTMRLVIEGFNELLDVAGHNERFRAAVRKVIEILRDGKTLEEYAKDLENMKNEPEDIGAELGLWKRIVRVNLMGSKLFYAASIINFVTRHVYHAQPSRFRLTERQIKTITTSIRDPNIIPEKPIEINGASYNYIGGIPHETLVFEENYVPTTSPEIDRDHPYRLSLRVGEESGIVVIHHYLDQNEVDTLLITTLHYCQTIKTGF